MKKCVLLLGLLAGILLSAASPEKPVVFGGREMLLVFDPESGGLREIRTPADTIRLGGGMDPVDISVGKGWYFKALRSKGKTDRLLRLRTSKQETREGRRILTQEFASPDWKATLTWEIPKQGGMFLCRSRWKRLSGEKEELIGGIRFNLPGVAIGDAANCRYSIPLQWPPRDVPFSQLTPGKTGYAAPWILGMASAVVHNGRSGVGLCVSPLSLRDYFAVATREEQNGVDLSTEIYPRKWMKKGDELEVGDQLVSVTGGSFGDAVAAAGKSWTEDGFKLEPHPAWTRGAVLYSSYPGGGDASWYRDIGGLKNFRKFLLPRLKELGVGCLWLNPINPGGYALTDYLTVHPVNGTVGDLNDLVAAAGEQDTRVILDLIPHGPTAESELGKRILKEHPEWVSHDRNGKVKFWWGGLSMDYASPGWQEYMGEVAAGYLRKNGISGWRVDVAGNSPDNETPTPGLLPSQSGMYGSLKLLDRVGGAMAEVRPDAILLGECCSVTHLSEAAFIYDFNLGLHVIPALADLGAAAWAPLAKEWLERQQQALPAGGVDGMMRFSETHDERKGLWRYGAGYEQALLSLCFLIPGLPLVYNDQDTGFGPHIAALARLRKRPEFVSGRALYLETESSSPEVFAFTRAAEDRFSLVAINFGGESRTGTLGIPPALRERRLPGRELVAGAEFKLDSGKGSCTLTIPPYETRVIAFAPGATPSAAVAETGNSAVAETPLRISRNGDGVTLENSHYRLTLNRGLVASLTGTDGKPLLTFSQVSGGADAAPFRESTGVTAAVESGKKETSVIFRGTWTPKPGCAIPWETVYRCDKTSRVDVEFRMQKANHAPVRLELSFGNAEEWFVAGFGGDLRDTYRPTHPAGNRMEGRYAHLSGQLWSAGLLPPNPADSRVAIRNSGTWVGVGLPFASGKLDDACFRERTDAGVDGLCLDLTPAADGAAAFTLTVGDPPRETASRISGSGWSLSAESASCRFRNRFFRLDVSRSKGGRILGLFAGDGEHSLLGRNRIYTDRGIVPGRKDSQSGKELAVTASSEEDLEAELRIGRNGDKITLGFSGILRNSYWNWKYPANPRIPYRLSYELSPENAVRVRGAAVPTVDSPSLDAFLAYTLAVPDVRSATVTAAGKSTTTDCAKQAPGVRFALSPQPPERIVLTRRDGTELRFSELAAPAGQRFFLIRNEAGELVIVFALFDGVPAAYHGEAREFTYTLGVFPAGKGK